VSCCDVLPLGRLRLDCCRARNAYKAVQNKEDFVKELPQCGLGAMLLQWLKQVLAALQECHRSRHEGNALQTAPQIHECHLLFLRQGMRYL
jgi:hypothetical protein